MSETIIKCPWCSHQMVTTSVEDPHPDRPDQSTFWRVECPNGDCEACGPWKPTEAEAIEAWMGLWDQP